MTKEEALKTYYGYDVFRGGQEAVIDALLSGRDALAIMPTGAGKSVCYQIPALLLSGITLVVSPLVSLMRDQVTQLVQMGIPAAFLNSSLTFRQYLLALDRARAGRYKIIYVAPERLETEGFQAFVREADISLVAVDEAHCISQWGQDFRPSYLNIPAFVESLPHRPPVGAFTATATPDVKADIHRLLDLQDPLELTTGFDRENLYFEVQQPADKRAALLELVKGRPGKCGIVYCATRKNVEEVCDFLRQRGVAARGAAEEPGGLPLRPGAGDGGHQRLRHGHRQVRCPVCHPLQYAQGHGELLPGGGPGGPGRGALQLHPVVQWPGCAD